MTEVEPPDNHESDDTLERRGPSDLTDVAYRIGMTAAGAINVSATVFIGYLGLEENPGTTGRLFAGMAAAFALHGAALTFKEAFHRNELPIAERAEDADNGSPSE